MTKYSSSEDSNEDPEIIKAKRERKRLQQMEDDMKEKKEVCDKFGDPLAIEMSKKFELETQQAQAEELIVLLFNKPSEEIYKGWLERITPYFNQKVIGETVVRTFYKNPFTGNEYEVIEDNFEHCYENREERFTRQLLKLNYFHRKITFTFWDQIVPVDRDGEKKHLFYYYGDDGW